MPGHQLRYNIYHHVVSHHTQPRTQQVAHNEKLNGVVQLVHFFSQRTWIFFKKKMLDGVRCWEASGPFTSFFFRIVNNKKKLFD